MKVAFHDVRAHLGTTQIAAHFRNHALAAGRPASANGVGFHIVVQKLAGVQVRAVRRQQNHADLFSVLLKPPLHLSRLVHRVLIHDQIDPTPRAAHQASQKLDEDIAGETFFEHHESQRASIRNRRDHVAPPSLSGSWDDWGPSLATVRGAGLMVVAKPHLVAPVDFRPLSA